MHLWVGVLVLLGVWVAHIWHDPYVTCTHCDDEKKTWDAGHEHFHHTDCPWCRRTGYRYRWELRWLTLF